MQAARVEFTPLFYAFNNPKYQLLHLRDMCQRERYPSAVHNFIKSNESFRRTLTCDASQGVDFIQEEMNRLQKSFLPPNMPTAETWRRVSRNATTLNHVKENMMNISKTTKKKKKFEHEITMMRRELRSSNLFLEATDQILSIDHAELDWELSDIKFTALTQYENYKCDYLKNKKFGFDRDDRKLVFITPEERKSFEDIKNKSKEYILKKINNMLSKINSEKEIFLKLLGKVPMRLKKSALLEIYDEIKLVCDLKEINTSVVSVSAGTGDLCDLSSYDCEDLS